MNKFESPTNNIKEAIETERLNSYEDAALEILEGEKPFDDTGVYDHLKKSLASLKKAGVDISLRAGAEKIIAQIPKAEINNELKKAEEYLKNGDIASARSWYEEAMQTIKDWKKKRALKKETELEFQKRVDFLESQLYQ